MTSTKDIREASKRGAVDLGWLRSRHSFSYASYYDPEHMGFSHLLVINDEHVAPSGGYAEHSHKDMEIFTYVLRGSLGHQDTFGNNSLLRTGDVQLISAGTGITHSEYNSSSTDQLHFLQIWIVPNRKGIESCYQEQHFSLTKKRGRLCLLLSPDGLDGSLTINQDVWVYAGMFDGGESTFMTLPVARHAYVHVASGSLNVNGERMTAGDGLKIRQAHTLEFGQGNKAEVLVFNLSPREYPRM